MFVFPNNLNKYLLWRNVTLMEGLGSVSEPKSMFKTSIKRVFDQIERDRVQNFHTFNGGILSHLSIKHRFVHTHLSFARHILLFQFYYFFLCVCTEKHTRNVSFVKDTQNT